MRCGWLCMLLALGTALPLRTAAQEEQDGSSSEVSADEQAPLEPNAEPGANTAPAAVGRATWSLRLSAGVGVGSRALDLPMDGRIYQIRSGLTPAVDLGFELDHAVSQDVSVGLLIRYQSSVGLRIVEHLTDGTEHPRATRSQQLQLAIAPIWRLDSRARWALGAAIGYGISELRPESHLVTPAYFLGGPYARFELQLPLIGERVRLRAGPEMQWIAQAGQELLDRDVRPHGLAVGGEAALEVVLGRRWTVAATYRELRAWLDSAQGGTFRDVTRFITARLSGVL